MPHLPEPVIRARVHNCRVSLRTRQYCICLHVHSLSLSQRTREAAPRTETQPWYMGATYYVAVEDDGSLTALEHYAHEALSNPWIDILMAEGTKGVRFNQTHYRQT